MEIIAASRRGGKTTAIMEACARDGGYIVVPSRQEVIRVARVARDTGYSIPFPLTFDEFLRHSYHGAGVKQLWIDNADMLLQQMAHVRIAGVTLTLDPKTGASVT